MSFYETLRHFADSYWLVVMTIMFLTFCLWPFRPGAGDRNNAAANSIFEEDNDGR
ncbi:cbb3-type cytochrome c oxidase subunit 3 [Parerythrobacter jejuensis]|uniref:CcoQ/FixQ family Cbb3-type cytochrome c oxidase assembly chaperone n=1 Tax=Parerythrobacter jejuensis TaxID=795812 RepID=A0A845AW49_9SPHN|nr:cbb3-type cytochrome c oxidase subunit 3 [Parerythrobacter jejuensis]MXP30633.1 CcoQ/FixQ family Cbb3-type cytochrome c oxidase assembly chaperone [Parerythrobacter jejuensis]MXP33393.1 CcoQ/FixQ family Cbb3-type cytochrome c oxidase assembly chaperone [Parerythrobacter jejuensis]